MQVDSAKLQFLNAIVLYLKARSHLSVA